MTKKELKQEAKEWLNKWELCNKCDHKVQCIEDNAICPQVVERAYLASAEPREKQIQIDAEQIRALQKQNGELTDKVAGLKKQLGNLYEIIKRPYQFTAPRKIQMIKEAEQFLRDN